MNAAASASVAAHRKQAGTEGMAPASPPSWQRQHERPAALGCPPLPCPALPYPALADLLRRRLPKPQAQAHHHSPSSLDCCTAAILSCCTSALLTASSDEHLGVRLQIQAIVPLAVLCHCLPQLRHPLQGRVLLASLHKCPAGGAHKQHK